jgi:DMSO/TMAO reductase YedYZ molybdopterin-dependent catalytic subunit
MSPARSGFWAGLAAGFLSATAIYSGWFTDYVPVVALALWDRQMRLIPMQLFSFLIVRLKFAAKPTAFWGMLAVLVVLLGLVGAVVARWSGRRPARLLAGAWVVVTGVLALLTLRPASGYLAERLAAAGLTLSPLTVPLALGGYGIIFAGVFTALVLILFRPPASGQTTPDGMTRRALLSRAVTIVLASAAGGAAAQWLASSLRRVTVAAQGLFARIEGLPSEITPNDQFYVVSKNPPGFDPVVDASKWSLQLSGLVTTSTRLTYDDLKAMPATEQVQTLECISNEVGGDLISTARWKGVRLRDVLQRAGGLHPTAIKVVFRCADGYKESLPIVDAIHPATLLAYEMNGEPLPPQHGFPVRLLVPGLFGMKNPKWITAIEAVDYDLRGYWEASGWSEEAVVKTMSEFTGVPRSVPAGEVGLGGVAYAGDRGIKSVEYSADDGKTWHPAEVKPPLGPFTWVLWAALWRPTAPEEYTLKVRARDAVGILQSPQHADTLPDGASGYHTLRVRVRS